jgi:hypothetical protein
MNQPRLGVEPTPLPATDLAAVFGRGNTLRGRLQPVRPAAPPPTPDSDASPPDDALPLDDEGSPATRRSDTRTAAPTADTVPRGVIVYVSVSVRERLRHRRRTDGTPFADIVLDAVEATHDTLDDLIASRRPPTERSALFVRSARAAAGDEPHVQVYLRLPAENLRILDHLTQTHRAPNRSALIGAALEAYL